MINREEWRAVVGYEGLYEVSDQGRVRSLDRFYLTRDGKPRGFLVHRLVAQAFLGSAPEGKPNVLHSDNAPDNNRVTNLRWGTQKENIQDAVDAGTADFWGHKKNPKPNCPRGHPYSGGNLYIDPRGRRVCRTCKREWARRKHGYKDFRV